MASITLVTLDALTAKMAGPAIRMSEMARVLARHGHSVRLLTFGACDRQFTEFAASATSARTFREDFFGPHGAPPDITILQGYVLSAFPWLAGAPTKLVIDLYDPFHLESLQVGANDALDDRVYALSTALGELQAQGRAGDFFLCASEAQRDFWLGQLAAQGRINPATFDADITLRSLIDVVPFGISTTLPAHTHHGIKGGVEGISPDDQVIVWGGGIYNWFDPLTVIRAVDSARHRIPSIRLFFLGAGHPNPDVPAMRMAAKARELVAELSLSEHVFFNDTWVDYAERHNYLLDADLAVSAHFESIETAFSFRTRILDYLWAGLPIVCTEGDYFAELVEREGCGRVVPYEDANAMAEAFIAYFSDEAVRSAGAEASKRVAQQFQWESCLEPLVRYCAAPYAAADAEMGPVEAGHRATLGTLARASWNSLHEHGLGETVRHVGRFVAKQRHS